MWISSCTAYVSHIRRDVNKVTIKNTKRIVSNVIIRYMSDQSDLIPMDLEQYNNNNKKAPSISWYPGHIAKAERELADYLKKVDVVIEVRDARIPLSTTHPMVPSWVGNKPLIIAIARLDQISKKALADWKEYYAMNPAHPERPDARVYFIDGKTGSGTLSLKRQALKAGVDINEKRVKKGIQPRAVRAAVIGFPNVGKRYSSRLTFLSLLLCSNFISFIS